MPKTRRKNLLRFLPSRRILLVGLVAIVVAGVFLAWSLQRNDAPNNSDTSTSSSGEEPYINLEPATEQEKKETEEHKKDLASQNEGQNNLSQTSTGKNQVTPVITSSDESAVRAYVPGIFEEGGTCSATVTKGPQTITRTSEGFGNASYTNCAPIDLSGANLSSGTWEVKVRYSSSKSEGISQPYTMEVQ